MDKWEGINANNYIRELRALYEQINPNKAALFIGRVCTLGAITSLVLTLLNIDKGILYIYFGSMLTIFLGVFAFMILSWTNWTKNHARSILKKAEDDLNNRNYVTERVIVGDCDFERQLETRRKRDKRKNVSYFSQKYRPMLIYDIRSKKKIYRYIGMFSDEYVFEYRTQLEVTYLANSRIIDSIAIADVEKDLLQEENMVNVNVRRIKIAGEVIRVMTSFEEGVYSYKVAIRKVDGRVWTVGVIDSIYYRICHRAEAIFELAMVFENDDVYGAVNSDLSKIEAAYVMGEDITEEEYMAQEEIDRAWLVNQG